MSKENLNRAKEFFADSKNEEVDKVYFTSDGNMFRAKHYAESWAGSGKVETVYRAVIETLEGKTSKVVKDTKADKIPAGNKEPEADKEPEAEKDPEADKDPEGDKEPEADKEPANTEVNEADEKEALVKRYIELYDTKPNHMSGIARLKEKIAEKEAANAKEGLED